MYQVKRQQRRRCNVCIVLACYHGSLQISPSRHIQQTGMIIGSHLRSHSHSPNLLVIGIVIYKSVHA